MADTITPVAPQPSQLQPVKPTQAPVKPTAPAPTAPDPVAAAEKLLAEAKAERAAAEKRSRVNAAEARKFADEKKGIGAKLSEYEQLKKAQAQAKLNKAAYLKSLYGDDWYDQIVQERLNGGSPTADTVALEVERVREEFSKKFDEHKSELTKAEQARETQRIQSELKAFSNSATEFAKANANDYPVFESLGDVSAQGAAIANRIRSEHDRTIKRDPETGEVIQPGRVMSMKEAADAIEADLLAIAERAVSADKYRARLTDKFKPATVPPSGTPSSQLRRTEPVERRTLSNDLTATTQDRKPAMTDAERRERANAAYAAIRAKGST